MKASMWKKCTFWVDLFIYVFLCFIMYSVSVVLLHTWLCSYYHVTFHTGKKTLAQVHQLVSRPLLFILAIFCRRPQTSIDPNLIIPDKQWYGYNEVLTFSCTRGFILTGDREKRCQQTGDFQQNLPTCKGKTKIRGQCHGLHRSTAIPSFQITILGASYEICIFWEKNLDRFFSPFFKLSYKSLKWQMQIIKKRMLSN